ncbi:MAG: methionyl-tRNA formyltransferase [Deltaproteobacteria bacterium]|nr:MAG: methionyl-tRNA formyltransferase [Deltaproteobacteria bacterium]
MRVIFMGTPDFAVPTLDAIVEAGHEVVLVVSQPDRPAGRGKKLTSPPVIERARALGLPTSQPRAIRSGSFPARVKSLNADAAVVVAYGRILTPELLDAPRHGCINVHASLLPRWRGAAPIQAAILAGDAETGVCTQRMVDELDAGDLFVEKRITLAEDETAGTLHDKLMALGAEAAVETLAQLGQLEPTPQNGVVTFVGKIDKAAGQLDLTRTAAELDRQIRGLSPWPGGFVPTAKGPLKIKVARPAVLQGPPGRILSTEPLVVGCGEGSLEIRHLQAPGKKPMSARDYVNGFRLAAGDPLVEE